MTQAPIQVAVGEILYALRSFDLYPALTKTQKLDFRIYQYAQDTLSVFSEIQCANCPPGCAEIIEEVEVLVEDLLVKRGHPRSQKHDSIIMMMLIPTPPSLSSHDSIVLIDQIKQEILELRPHLNSLF